MNTSIYDEAQIGDIIVLNTDDFISKFIRWVTDSKYSHVCVYIGGGEVIESANGYGVRIIDLDEYTEDPRTLLTLLRVRSLSPAKAKKIVEYAIGYIYRGYDFFGLIGIFSKHIVRKLNLNRWITFYGKNRADEAAAFWCSEFVGHCYEKFGIQFVKHDITYLTPDEIKKSRIVKEIKI